jgi:hypothetical protein
MFSVCTTHFASAKENSPVNTEKTDRAPLIPPSLPAATILKARTAALEIAAATGYDARTTLRALLHGADAIRPLRMREELRPRVDAWRTENLANRGGK